MIWYLSYGSNLSQERFLKYICGGSLDARSCNKVHYGCRDHTKPKQCIFKYLPHVEVYFARESKSWQNGGVGFIRQNNSDSSNGTIARMYLVTDEQFFDIVGQENGLSQDSITNDLQPTLQDIINRLKTDTTDDRFDLFPFLPEQRYYDSIVYLGQHEGYPILSFTNRNFNQKQVPPSLNYLQTITNGLKESMHEMNSYATTEQCVDYFLKKSGVNEKYSRKELLTKLK